MAEAGNVKLLCALWNSTFLDELASFLHGAHDDQVDAASLSFAQPVRKLEFWARFADGGDSETHQVPQRLAGDQLGRASANGLLATGLSI